MRPCPQKAERNKTMNRREFLANALKLSALGVLPVSLFGEPERPELFPAGKTTIGRRSFRGFSLPLLGLGLMNLPQDALSKRIDAERAKRLIESAMEQGINYFDSAPNYLGGAGEEFLGRILKKYPRSSYFLASKLRLNRIYSPENARKEVERQLRQCGTGSFDFYMLQMLDSAKAVRAEQLGISELFRTLKRQGKIRFAGVSFSDTPEVLARLLPRAEWDFIQIEINYADWDFCRIREIYKLLTTCKIPVLAVNALRGGDLEYADNKKIAQAYRFPISLPGVVLTICHASSEQQIVSAVQALNNFRSLSETEREQLVKMAEKLRNSGKLNPCGDCNCSKSNPAVDSRTLASCPFSIHPKNRRFQFL